MQPQQWIVTVDAGYPKRKRVPCSSHGKPHVFPTRAAALNWARARAFLVNPKAERVKPPEDDATDIVLVPALALAGLQLFITVRSWFA